MSDKIHDEMCGKGGRDCKDDTNHSGSDHSDTKNLDNNSSSTAPHGTNYEKLSQMVARLKRNDEQMTMAQKKQYAKQMASFRMKIGKLAISVAEEFLLTGVRILKEDDPVLVYKAEERLSKIIKDEVVKGTLRNAIKILLSTYSMDRFMIALCPAQCRVFYIGYGPYWAAHCHRVDQDDTAKENGCDGNICDGNKCHDNKGCGDKCRSDKCCDNKGCNNEDIHYTYYNDIIDMFWVPEWWQWKRKEKLEVTIMLPPTIEEIKARYAEEMKKLDTEYFNARN